MARQTCSLPSQWTLRHRDGQTPKSMLSIQPTSCTSCRQIWVKRWSKARPNAFKWAVFSSFMAHFDTKAPSPCPQMLILMHGCGHEIQIAAYVTLNGWTSLLEPETSCFRRIDQCRPTTNAWYFKSNNHFLGSVGRPTIQPYGRAPRHFGSPTMNGLHNKSGIS